MSVGLAPKHRPSMVIGLQMDKVHIGYFYRFLRRMGAVLRIWTYLAWLLDILCLLHMLHTILPRICCGCLLVYLLWMIISMNEMVLDISITITSSS